MERKTFTEKISYKSGVGKKMILKRRRRPWLEERSWKWGKMLEIRELYGAKKQGMHRALGWQHPRLVMMSSNTAGNDPIFSIPCWTNSDLFVVKEW